MDHVSDSVRCEKSAERTTSSRETEGSTVIELVGEAELVEELAVNGKTWLRLKRFASSFLGDSFEAEDVAQEVSERLLRAIRNGKAIERRGFSRYCHTVAYRLCLNRIQIARGPIVLAVTSQSEDGEEKDPIQSAPERWSWKDRTEARLIVTKALAQLPARERLIVELTMRDLADDDIAAQAAVSSVTNVRQIRYRAHVKLRAIVAETDKGAIKTE